MMKGGVGSFCSLENLEMIGATMGDVLEELCQEGHRFSEEAVAEMAKASEGRKALYVFNRLPEIVRDVEDEAEAQADADEAGRREGVLKPEESIEDLKARCLVALFESWKERNLKADTDELVLRRLRGELDESDAQIARQVESCHRARLKSPEILASKARLRARKVARLTARFVDEGRNNALSDPGSGLSEREAERLQERLGEIMNALEWKPVLTDPVIR